MKIKVIAFGKLKNPGFRDSADHYLKNLRSFAEVEEIELKPERVESKSSSERKRLQEAEAGYFFERLKSLGLESAPLIALDEGGKAMKTQDWAKALGELERTGHREIAFIIGSSIGLSEALKTRARLRLSLGPQTLAHELARVVLYEQIYRAFSILRGHPYHNEG